MPSATNMGIWRADVGTRTVSTEPIPDAWERLGGRGLGARILLDEVCPTCQPLGGSNKLLLMPGLLGGHRLSSCDRLSICAKSPLTGGVKESNAGGTTALKLARLGVKALIIEGVPQAERWWVLHLSAAGARFDPAGDLAGLGTYAAARQLLARYGHRVGLALIGPGGELGLSAAGIANLDKDGQPSRMAARGGLGAVMGAMRLKAIVVDDSAGSPPSLAHPEAYRAAARRLVQAVLAQPQTKSWTRLGTAGMVQVCNAFGGLPTRGFSAGEFEHAEEISGETMRELIMSRGGEGNPRHACMPGCVIRCSNVFPDAGGSVLVSPLEYETIGLCGANLGLGSLDAIARLNHELNDLGLDTIEIGAALGVAAQAGLMPFGDGQRALALIDEIRRATPLGRVLGHGAELSGKVFGVLRVPTVKGQALSAYDPRAIKGTGVTYATSPQGADHTAGLTIRAKVDHLDPDGQVALSRTTQINTAGYDSLGACSFTGFGFAAAPGVVRELLHARYGWDPGENALEDLGRETLRLERSFNRADGFGPMDDRIPEWMTQEPLPGSGAVFDVPPEELDSLFDWDTDR